MGARETQNGPSKKLDLSQEARKQNRRSDIKNRASWTGQSLAELRTERSSKAQPGGSSLKEHIDLSVILLEAVNTSAIYLSIKETFAIGEVEKQERRKVELVLGLC